MKNLFRITRVLLILSTFINPSCMEDPTLPSLTTTVATAVSYTSAISGGEVTDDGGEGIISRGVCWYTSANPTTLNSNTIDGNGVGVFTSNIIGLTPNTAYYLKAYAINSVGTGYGNEVTFSTSQIAKATLTTTINTSVSQTRAVSGGNIIAENGGPVTSRGVCWSATTSPTIEDRKTSDGSGTGTFASSIIGLVPNTTYYIRAYAINSAGIVYGDNLSFTTQNYGSVIDIEGTVYKTITIGTQTWMAENLKTTKYNDGTTIPLVTDGTTWSELTTPAYCWFNNDETTYKTTYGALYNWYTVNTGKLPPSGWHVPSAAEWYTLAAYLGGINKAGGKLKEVGTAHWIIENQEATNESGFTALPGGFRYYFGLFGYVRHNGGWWSTTEHPDYPTYDALPQYMSAYSSYLYGGNSSKKNGLSVRCIKDN